jgi:hypothetical protein
MSLTHTPRESGSFGVSESFIMRAGLGVAKEARKKAELDARLLANRIALLKQEEDRANKKISETRRRAQEILKARQRSELRERQRRAIAVVRSEEILRSAEHAKRLKADIQARKQEVLTALQESKRKSAIETKAELKEYVIHTKGDIVADRQKKQGMTEMVKRSREEARRRLDREKMARLEIFKLDYAVRVEQEDMLRLQTEQLVTAMEQQEREMIARLQNKQLEQQSAFEALEKVYALTQSRMSTSRGSTGTRPSPQLQPLTFVN